VQKQDQRSGKLTEGVVQQILTKSAEHPHGIKVRLMSGEVGRVQAIWEEEVWSQEFSRTGLFYDEVFHGPRCALIA
jgi:uncharacterized repeat protein (TIGR03833 family)